MSCTVGIFIVEHQITLTAAICCTVDDDRIRSEYVLAGILHYRHRDVRHIGLCQTVHILLRKLSLHRDTIRTVDGEMLGNLGSVATDIIHRVGSGHVDHARGIHHVLAGDGEVCQRSTVVVNEQVLNFVHHSADIRVSRRNHRTTTTRQRLIR